MACCQCEALRKPDRADDGRHAEAHLREPELGSLARDDEVAPAHQREPVPEAVAVDRGDHRLEDLPSALEGVRRGLLPERSGEVAHGVAAPALDVSAHAERLPGAGHDRDPRVLVVPEAAERRR